MKWIKVIQPKNINSINLVKANGFRKEGYSPICRFLKAIKSCCRLVERRLWQGSHIEFKRNGNKKSGQDRWQDGFRLASENRAKNKLIRAWLGFDLR